MLVPSRAIGAWNWLGMRRLLHDGPLPVSVSPDVALTWARGAGEAHVLAIAQVVAPVAFDGGLPVAEGDAARAWASPCRGAGCRGVGAAAVAVGAADSGLGARGWPSRVRCGSRWGCDRPQAADGPWRGVRWSR